eukprot:TRINITY_DN1806_c2_g1_i1.p1 TRINITY_DN1806_c2_g1~~TRINITY_DN1806_c2_g1_i1.p1  ORF type:complete len:370 (+),score=107.13 TRINITY_DN1806_c2_g1_i1:79-1110(+)
MPVPPLVIGCVGNGVLLSVSDCCAQLIERGHRQKGEGRGRGGAEEQGATPPCVAAERPYDWWRTARFAGIGVFLTGPLTYMRYGILGRLFGVAASPHAALEKMLTNQLCFDPPETLIHLAGLEWLRSNGDVDAVVAKCRADFWSLQVPGWLIAIPVNICTFSLWSNVWEQMLFQRTVSCCFNVYFSYVANRAVRRQGKPQGAVLCHTPDTDSDNFQRKRAPEHRRRLWRRGAARRGAPRGGGPPASSGRGAPTTGAAPDSGEAAGAADRGGAPKAPKAPQAAAPWSPLTKLAALARAGRRGVLVRRADERFVGARCDGAPGPRRRGAAPCGVLLGGMLSACVR